jgi:hypothetical protein
MPIQTAPESKLTPSGDCRRGLIPFAIIKLSRRAQMYKPEVMVVGAGGQEGMMGRDEKSISFGRCFLRGLRV